MAELVVALSTRLDMPPAAIPPIAVSAVPQLRLAPSCGVEAALGTTLPVPGSRPARKVDDLLIQSLLIVERLRDQPA
jgi:hypothetical protein